MKNKSTTPAQASQELIAGMNLQNPTDIEFFGIKKNKTVQFLQAGQVFRFEQLKPCHYALLITAFYKDQPAVEYFKQFNLPLKRKIELYTYYLFGTLDHKPDIVNGVLQSSENFRDSPECPSLSFSGKDITIDGVILTLRDLTIIDMSARECTDYEIADALNISLPTLDFHKKKLFIKTKTQTKLGFVMKAYTNQILH